MKLGFYAGWYPAKVVVTFEDGSEYPGIFTLFGFRIGHWFIGLMRVTVP